MVKDLLKISGKVEQILLEVPATRDCDKKLFLHYIARNTSIKFILGEDGWKKFCLYFMRNEIPKLESITRVRRKFQEQGLYVGKKRMERMIEAEAVKEWSRQQ